MSSLQRNSVIFVGLGGFLLALLVVLPYLFLGKDVHVIVSDNLDSNFVWLRNLASQGKLLAHPSSEVEGFLLVTPRFSFPSGIHGFALLYAFMDSFWAFAVQKFLISWIAFVSMYYWSGRLLCNANIVDRLALAAIWASLVFYPHRGISLAAIPLLAWLFTSYKDQKIDTQAIIFLLFYGFYSTPLLSGWYVWFGFFAYTIFYSISSKKTAWSLVLFLGLWLLCYLIQEYHYLYQFFVEDEFISHRTEFSYYEYLWKDWNPISLILYGDYSGIVYSLIYPVMVFFGLLFFGMQKKLYGIPRVFTLLLIFILGFCWLISRYFSWSLGSIDLPILQSLNLLRFNHWIPFLLFSVLGYWILQMQFSGKRLILVVLVGINCLVYQYEWRHSFSYASLLSEYRTPSFREYFAEKSYDEIKAFLGPDWSSLRLIHVNMPPAVSVYNGMRSLDGYIQNYALEHKYAVGKVIAEEIRGNEFLEWQFWRWGNKCYFQNSTYPDDYMRYQWLDFSPIMELSWDFEYLKQVLGADIVLSSVPIDIQELEFLNRFEHPNSAWKIYIYSIR
ncbi:DUF6044 family protein [Mongoliitalea lutea]|uniref:Putative membrane protein YkoS n=1 Tax=Mongoliitalea lutea TaxID=849756 RepID=A0A8J3CTP9_9BACT|nr:DUF6044 family protein [Mongoliitalea lutea]GHB23704.1 putative membrane protein YkoS [Mongoliitalea lutea]